MLQRGGVPPFLVLVPLLGSALLVTRLTDGPVAVRWLLARAIRRRFGRWRWAVIVFGLPLLTTLIAAASGGSPGPDGGWTAEIGSYLFATLVFGALALNPWEETAWGGFAQSRLMARHGLLVAFLITVVVSAGPHVPLSFAGDPVGFEIVIGW